MKSFTVSLLISTLFASAVALAAPAANEAGLPYKGKVVSVIDAGQYTYIEVLQDKKTLWLAAPAVALKKDAMIRFEDGAEMTNFRSNSLNRTFPAIRFIGRVVVSDDKK
jgi:hypothetical protein